MKVARTVWSGGKDGDNIKILPITIVYAIAITAMAFFVDPTISTLTSGTPSQNVDLGGISFPRRLGFRLASAFAEKHHLVGQQVVWQAYSDSSFSEKASLGPDFYHEDIIDRTRWSRMYVKGIFPTNTVYLKCIIRNTQTKMHLASFYFKFVKGYQTSLSGRTYIKDPVLGMKIIKDGTLYEIRPYKDKSGQIKFRNANKTYKAERLVDISSSMHTDILKMPAIEQMVVRYSEKPKMVFLVTPPHLTSYAKIILILLSQLVNLNFEQSYMTRSSQKPDYKTKFMLDELGIRFSA